jgi:hypothetical protein
MATQIIYIIYIYFWWDWGLKAGALPLEPHLQSILLWLFWKRCSHELFARADTEQ